MKIPSEILLSVLLILSIPGEGAAADKTMKRIDDPVVVEGKDLAPLVGKRIDRLSLMAWTRGSFQPVPFQVDKRDKDNKYIFTEGPKRKPISDPTLGGNDELVFMIFDAGGRAPQGQVPSGAEEGMELELIDPVDGGRAWVYLFSFAHDAPVSDRNYITGSFDVATHVWRVEAKNYIIEFKENAIYFHYLSLRQPDGTLSPDLVDRLKIRGKFSFLFGSIKIPFKADEDIKTQITAWKNGPVRLLVRGEGYIDKWAKIRLEGYSVLRFYPGFYILPITLAVPFDLNRVLTKFDLRGYTDFTESIYGAHFFDKYNPWNPDVVFDGKMDDAEKNLNTTEDRDWVAGFGPYGAIVNRIVFPKEWSFVKKRLYYVDDAQKADPPEDNPGLVAVGYEFDGFIDIKKGQPTYWLHFYFPQGFTVGDQGQILNIMDHPLEAKAYPVDGIRR